MKQAKLETVDVDKWNRCHRDPRKLDAEIQRSCREKDIPLEIRQTGGSHRVYKTPRGSLSIPQHHNEIPKGTWGSIWKMLLALGIAGLPIVAVLLKAKGLL